MLCVTWAWKPSPQLARTPGWAADVWARQVPDLTDAAMGGVLALTLGPGWTFTRYPDDYWEASSQHEDFHGDTLGEACARALLAVWGAE